MTYDQARKGYTSKNFRPLDTVYWSPAKDAETIRTNHGCDHSKSTYSYNTYGFCTNCGATDYDQNAKKWGWSTACASSNVDGTYKVNSTSAPLHKTPYDGDKLTPSTNNKVKTLSKGAAVTVLGSFTNSKGSLWYAVDGGSGNTYYIYSKYLTLYQTPASVKCTPTVTKKTINQGESQYINGVINAEGCKIESVRAYFQTAGSSKELYPTGSIDVNGKSYSLNKSTLDKSLKFGKLSTGTYCFVVEATMSRSINGSKTVSFASDYFTVGKNTVAAPNIKEDSAVLNGKYISISGDGTIYYRIDGGSYKKYGGKFLINSTSKVEAYCEKNGTKSAAVSKTFSVPYLDEPVISYQQTSKGATVKITGPSRAEIKYSIGNTNYDRTYSGAFTVSQNCTVYARVQRQGYISEVSSKSVTVAKPANFSISLNNTESNIAVGSSATVSWPSVSLAASYKVSVYKGSELYAMASGLTKPQYSVNLKDVGTYTFEVEATNAIGTTASVNKLKVTTHEPSTVTFKDWDGTVLETQTVRYGFDAVAPSRTPTRRGYTFSGWNRSFYNVKTDLEIQANYYRNRYTVNFYDYDGSYLTCASVYFEDPVDTAAAESLVTLKTGYVFGGWMVRTAADDSNRDLGCVDSNMDVIAVTGWGNAKLPVVVTNLRASSYYDAGRGGTTGYNVSFDISSIPDYDTKAKLVASLCGSDNSLLGVGVTTINSVADSQNKQCTVFISYENSATVRPAYVQLNVLSVDGSDRTGGLIAQTVTCIPSIDSSDETAWSAWSPVLPDGKSASDTDVQTRTVYRGRQNTKTTTTNTTGTAPSGYTLSGSTSSWGNWSGWLDYSVASSSKRSVETRKVQVTAAYTQYRYGRWYRDSQNNSYCTARFDKNKADPWIQYTSWSTTPYKLTGSDFTCGNTSYNGRGHNHVSVAYYENGNPYWHGYSATGSNTASGRYYWQETRKIDATYKTQYRYRDLITTYTYYKWLPGEWSDWTTSPLSSRSDGSYTAESRKEYRYVVLEQPTTSQVTERTITFDTSKVNGDPSLLATVVVYRSQNTDPTESQLEFVGQTTLGEVNGYTYKPKEEPSFSTGDYIVALAVEGYGGLINIGKVEAPKREYTVNYYSADGQTLLLSETVEEGGSVAAPEAPQIEGMMFVGWSAVAANVTGNMDVLAVYAPYTYAVVYVDYLNQTCELKRVDGGSVLSEAETVPSHEGYTFDGWFKEDGTPISEGDTVSDDMIITAKWTPNTYTVTFCNVDGSVFSEQEVCYGEAAELPDAPAVPENMVFLAWDEDVPWWDVTADITVYPIVAYTASAVLASNINGYNEAYSEVLEFYTNETATVYYTLDGSEPDPANVAGASEIVEADAGVTYVYTGPMELTETSYILAKAVAPDMNDSQTIEIEFYPIDYIEEEAPETVELAKYNAYIEPGETVELSVMLSEEIDLQSYLFYVDADPVSFYVPYNEELDDQNIVPGAACNSGYFLHGDYTDGLGWQVLWASTEPLDGSGTLFTITLQATDEMTAGVYPITIRYSPYNTVTSEDISAAESDIEVAIGEGDGIILGDVNGNGSITNADVIRVARYVIGDIELDAKAMIAADVTCDGRITNADVIRLAKYIIGAEEIG